MDEKLSSYARFGGAGETNVSLAVGIAVALAILLILLLPRKYVSIPFLLTIFLIPAGEQIVLGGMHLMMFRVAIFFGGIRVLFSRLVFRSNGEKIRMNRLDWAVLLWCISSALTFTALWGEWGAFVNRMGFVYNTIGGYFILRFLLQDEEDGDRVTRFLAVFCAFVAACMTYEHFTGQNIFSFFGGVATLSGARDGNIRAQGPFAHPILAGTFGATLLPLFFGLWWQERKYKASAILGMVSAIIMASMCWSSTPLLGCVAGIGALCFWPFRRTMRIIRWGAALGILALHLVMKAPVWALIGRVGPLDSSSGYHRYFLVDQFIRRFWEWWLVGTRNSGSWGYDMWDTSNQYVDVGVTGGLLTFVVFITIIVYCFKELGIVRAHAEAMGNSAAERRSWALGSTLFATSIAFIGISYFDQTMFLWYCLLAMIATLHLAANVAPDGATEQERSDRFSDVGASHLPAQANVKLQGRFIRHTPPGV
jgi:hypothetical protein